MDELSKYLPLRFLICMISAIGNPFLYGYFNETFKDGLEKIFSLCCPEINRETNQISFDQTTCSLNKKNLENNSNRNIRPSNYQSSVNKNGNTEHSLSIARFSHDPSTRLTIISLNHVSPSFSAYE